MELESNGRRLIMTDDSITISPNRLDCLLMAKDVYKEYSKGGCIGKDTFIDWLNQEITKEEDGKKD